MGACMHNIKPVLITLPGWCRLCPRPSAAAMECQAQPEDQHLRVSHVCTAVPCAPSPVIANEDLLVRTLNSEHAMP